MIGMELLKKPAYGHGNFYFTKNSHEDGLNATTRLRKLPSLSCSCACGAVGSFGGPAGVGTTVTCSATAAAAAASAAACSWLSASLNDYLITVNNCFYCFP
jgi:hypothetical protein